MLSQRCSTSGHFSRSRTTCYRPLSESTCARLPCRSLCTSKRRTVRLQSGKDPGQTYNSSNQTQEKEQNAGAPVKTANGPESSVSSGSEASTPAESAEPQTTGAELSKDSESASNVRSTLMHPCVLMPMCTHSTSVVHSIDIPFMWLCSRLTERDQAFCPLTA